MSLRTPLYAWHLEQGARMVEFGGWDMPIQYTTITEEHQAVRNGAGLFDISHMGRLLIEGADAEAFLQYVFTNDVSTMKPGQVRYGLVCNEAGGVLDDVLVYRLQPFWLMVVNASNREKIVAWLTRWMESRSVKVTDHTFDWGMIAVQGPSAIPPSEPTPYNLHVNPGTLRYYFASVDTREDCSDLEIVSRTGYTGEDGFEAIVAADRVLDLVNRIRAANPAVRPCGLGARDTLRLEAAMPLYGHELGEDIDPFQTGLGWAVKMNKPDFLGKVALEERSKDPSRRVRIGLQLAGKRIAREGAEVFAGRSKIGVVTSGTFAPTLQKALAMAYVGPEHAKPGMECEVDIRGKREKAQVVELPFYKRAKN
jgi:aminomethyltransferase